MGPGWASALNNNENRAVLVTMGSAAVTKPSNLKGLKQQRFLSCSHHTSSRVAGRLLLTEQSHLGLPRESVLASQCSRETLGLGETRISLASTVHMTPGATNCPGSKVLPWAWEDKKVEIVAKSSNNTTNNTNNNTSSRGHLPTTTCAWTLRRLRT